MAYKPCKHLGLEDGQVARKNYAYKCNWLGEVPDLPASVTKSYDFKWPPPRRFITKDDCAACPCFAAKEGTT